MATPASRPMMNPPLRHATSLDQALLRLVSVEAAGDRTRIGLPIILGSGSYVDVTVWTDGDRFVVSDEGFAHAEVLNCAPGAGRSFAAAARRQSKVYGAEFDGSTILFLRVAVTQLRGAIAAMGSLIKEVVDETLLKAAGEKRSDAVTRMEELLREAFPNHPPLRDAEVYGYSTASYHVDLLIEDGVRQIAFDHFTPEAGSVAAAFVKLSDLFRLEDGPSLVGVTRDLAAVGPKLNLLNSVARIIPLDAPAEDYRRAA